MTTVDETVACTLAGTERMPSRFAETPTVTRASSDQTSGASRLRDRPVPARLRPARHGQLNEAKPGTSRGP